jgi:hypothetical protein
MLDKLLTLIGEMVYISHVRVLKDTSSVPFLGNLVRDPVYKRP